MHASRVISQGSTSTSVIKKGKRKGFGKGFVEFFRRFTDRSSSG